LGSLISLRASAQLATGTLPNKVIAASNGNFISYGGLAIFFHSFNGAGLIFLRA